MNHHLERAASLDLQNLSITPPNDYEGNFDINVTATATEPSTGSSSQTTSTISVNVLPEPAPGEAINYIDGTFGNDNALIGGEGIDYISGGFGHDTMTGGSGEDMFIWHQSAAQAGSVQEDHVTDFEAHKDVINVKDLLVGENSQNIDSFLNVTLSGSSTTIEVRPNGDGQTLQEIVLDNVDLFTEYGVAATDPAASSTLVQNLLQEGTLVIDQ